MPTNLLKDLPRPLNQLRPQVMERYLLQHLTEPLMTSDSKGQFWMPDALYAQELLLKGLPPRVRKRLEEGDEEFEYEETELIWNAGGVEGLLAIVDECQPDEVNEKTVVDCWVESSMASGCWSMKVFQTPKRGYVVIDQSDDLGTVEGYSIVGVWAPADHEQAMRECIIECYAAQWSACCLPPEMGECASGEQPLWLDCLERVVQEDSYAWDMVLERLPQREEDEYVEDEDGAQGITREQIEYVQKAMNLPAGRVLKLYARARYDVPDWLAAAVDKKSRGRVEAEGAIWDGESLPQDRELLRFLLANYCYELSRGE